MNYLGRPIFLFAPDWARAIARSATFELRPTDIGYGAEFFVPTELWTVNGWNFSLTLASAPDIANFDAFTTALIGPLSGFWLPVPFAEAVVVSGASTAQFDITGEQFATFWDDRPDTYLFFTFAEGTQAAAQIESVVTDGANETVTLTAPLPEIPNAGTAICKLHYVRLANDEESGSFLAENVMTRDVSVVELPTEYAAAETGLQPIYLFHFFGAAPVGTDWFYTSFAAGVVSNGKVYQPWPIDFSGLSENSQGQSDDLKITAKPDPSHPLSLFVPVPFSGTLYIEVFVTAYSAPNTVTKLFSGRVTLVEDQGTKYEATCESRLGFLKRKIPRYLKGVNCQNILYDQNTCRAGRAFFETTVDIVSIDNTDLPPTVVCAFAFPEFGGKFQPANFLANGLFEAGLGLTYEARSIISSNWNAGTGQLTLTLNLPLVKTLAGAQAQIVAGCDHTATTCQSKFKNYHNFNGFVAIPPRNPTLRAINANSVAGGGK